MAEETANPSYMATTYFDYQNKYAETPRESDRALIDLMSPTIDALDARKGARLLDIGCSNGNFLRLLKQRWPNVEFWGGDIQPEVIERCRREPSLAGIRFEVMNGRDMSGWPSFDAIVANAVLFRFDAQSYSEICTQLFRTLTPGGSLFAFDFHHRFEQDLTIVERSTWHPEGLTLNFRSYKTATALLEGAGFADVRYQPFEIGIDLPAHADPANIGTYTRTTSTGERIQFRGALAQPWCHLSARKP